MLFILTSLYFLLQGVNPGNYYASPSMACTRATDSLALVKFYNATNGPGWHNKWNLSLPMTQWIGVTLGGTGCVVELRVNSNNLIGSLPPEIGNLTGLRVLSLFANKLNGTLPQNIENLINLEDLNLEDNELTGTILPEIGGLAKIKYLNLARNFLTGNIPNTIGFLNNLLTLNLSSNQLTGNIPTNISFLTKLTILDLSRNSLSGTLPAALSQLALLKELYLSHNSFSGAVPGSLSNLISVVHFWINDNQFTGLVPDLRNSPLNSFHIENNSFTQIPDYSTVDTWGNQFPFGLVIFGNKFTFEDLVPLTKLPSRFYFSFDPQDPIELDSIIYVEEGTNYIIMTGVDPGFTESNYKWFKDTSIVYISNRNVYEILLAKESDEGYYSGRITNPAIPNFELTIAKFRVVVFNPARCDDPNGTNNCKSAPEFCSTQAIHGYCGAMGFKDTTNSTFLCDSNEQTSNPKWLSFVASADSIVFEIFPRNCTGVIENSILYTGMQAAIWNSCGGNEDSIVVCQSICNDQPFTLGGKFFEVGKKYNILLNGCRGDLCDFLIKVIAGKQTFELIEPGSITGDQTLCADTLDHLFSIDTIPGSHEYEWYVNDTLFRKSINPDVNIKGFDPGFYNLKVRAVSSCDTTNVSFLEFRVNPELVLKNPLHTRFNQDSAYQVSFVIEGGIKPYTIIKGSGVIDSATGTFYSDLLLCKSGYEFEIVDAHGCPIIYKGFENCNCNSQAGAMPADTIKVCEGQSLTVKFIGSETQDPNDAAVYILFTDPSNPKSSILKISGNGLFPFDPARFKFDIYYYISRVVGKRDARGEINFNHPCISYSNFQLVIFRSRPIVSAGPDKSFCGLEGNLNSLGNYINGLWKQVSGPSQASIENPIGDQTKVVVADFGIYVFAREVNNAHCTHKDEVRITFVDALKPVVGGFYFVCSGQTTALDGGDYSKFLWSTGDTTRILNINASGTYCLTVSDDNNCTGTTCIAVSNSTAPNPQLIGPDTVCTGDTRFIQLVQGYLKYQWNTSDSTSILPIDTGGTYCVTVTANNGCTGIDCITVASKARSYSNRSDTVCHGENFTLHGETFDTPGIHDVILHGASRNGCDSVIRIILNWRPQILLADTNIINDDGTGTGAISVIVSGGKSPFKYQWSNGAKTPIITNLVSGTYTLIVTDANNCNAVFVITVKRLTSTKDEKKQKHSFLIYPNPVHTPGTIMIENRSNANDLKLFIYNSSGIELYKQPWTSTGMNDVLPLHLQLNAGVYYIRILDAGGISEIQKIVLIN